MKLCRCDIFLDLINLNITLLNVNIFTEDIQCSVDTHPAGQWNVNTAVNRLFVILLRHSQLVFNLCVSVVGGDDVILIHYRHVRYGLHLRQSAKALDC